MRLNLLSAIIILLSTSASFAQVSFGSVIDDTTKNVVDSAVLNGRYQVKKRKPASTEEKNQTEVAEPSIKLKKKNGKSVSVKPSSNTSVDQAVTEVVKSAAANNDSKSVKEAGVAASHEVESSSTDSKEAAAESTAVAAVEAKSEENSNLEKVPADLSIAEQMKMLASGEGKKLVDMYQERIHPDDNRNNQLEADLLPSFTYVDSSSNYSYRRYQALFNALDFKVRFFMTPMLAVEGGTSLSLGADIPTDGATKSRVSAKFEEVNLGLVSKKFLGLSRKSPSFDTVFAYSDKSLSVPGSTTARFKLKSSGLGLGFRYHSPTSANFVNVYSMMFWPKINHSETSNNSVNSGSNNENYRLDFAYTAEMKFNRESQIFFTSGLSVEKNLFDGAAKAADPDTGATPSNVSVLNTIVQLGVGYRWGR